METEASGCSIGIALEEECNKKIYSRNVGILAASDLSQDDKKLLEWRSEVLLREDSTVCFHHEKMYLSKYKNTQRYCSDPFKLHKKRISKSLRAIDEDTAKELNLKPGQKLCPNCNYKYKQHDYISSSSSEEFEPLNRALQSLDTSSSVLGLSPIKSVSQRDKLSYGKRKIQDYQTVATQKVAKVLDVPTNELSPITKAEPCKKCEGLDRMICLLKDKCKHASRQEQIKLLTLVPASWTIKKTMTEFNVSEHIIKRAREVKKNKGILAEPDPKKGRPLSTKVVERVKAFYQSDEYSRMCPGKKEYVSVRTGDGREQMQKCLLLLNLKELHIEYLKTTGDKIGFSKFCELRPKCAIRKMFPSNESERGAFLKHVHEAREERQAERLKDAAAVQIQSVIRGWLVRVKIRKQIRKNFDDIFGTESSLPDIKTIPGATTVFKNAVKLFKVFERDKDSKRLEIYVRYLLASMDSNDLKVSYVCCAMNKDLTLQWIQHIKEVVVLACEELELLHVELGSENRLVSLFLHLLLTFSATTTWRLLQAEHLQPLRPALNKLTHNIMGELVSKGMYHSLQQVLIRGLCRGKPALRGPAITTIITLSLRPLLASEHSHNILSLMTIHIFSVPALLHYLVTLAPDGLRMFHSNQIFEQVLQFVYEEQNLKIVFNTLEGCYALCLLANLVHIAYLERETSLPLLAFPKFSFVVNQLLNKCGEYVSTKQSRLTQWHPLLGWFSQSLDQHLNDAVPLVRTQLELLWSAPVLRIMFEPLYAIMERDAALNKSSNGCRGEPTPSGTQSVKPKSFFKKALESGLGSAMGLTGDLGGGSHSGLKASLKLGSPEVTKISHICSMYYMTTSTLSQLKMDILTGICHRSEVLHGLWVVLLSLGPQCGLKTFLNLLSVTTKASAPEFHFLILFCDATTHLVSVLDDMEMYEQQKPFTIEDYRTISYFLNNLVYRMLKNGLVDRRNVSGCPLFNSAHTLLKLLYRRNSRRPFVEDSLWYISEVNVMSLMSEMDKKKKIAEVLIQNVPHILSHEDRVVLFRSFINKEKITLSSFDMALGGAPTPTIITVRRRALVEDGYRQLASLPPAALKGVIKVRFINQQGLDEAGIDQDGVFKEFLEETLKRIFDPSLNLFRLTSEERLYPSPTSSMTEDHLQLLEFTGRMLAKAIYEGILVDCPFASFFLSQVIGEQHSALYSFIDELPSLDSQLYKNLTYVKHYEGEVSELDLTFSYDEDYLGQVVNYELRPGGKGIVVTNHNRILYIHLMAHFKLYTQIKDQTKAFIRGFRSIIHQDWLALFSVPELQRLISGDNTDLDLHDLRQNTHYYGGFHDKHRVVCWLWDILKTDFSEQEKRLFLKFVTSCSKPPLLGFANLEPPFSIRCVEVNDDEDQGDTVGSVIRGFFAIRKKDPVNRLPTSSTCFNLLKLPNYQKRSNLKEKLRYAIHSNTGFELS